MNIYTENNNIIIEEVEDFDLSQTLECGQCFRFYHQGKNEYVIVAYDRLLHIKQERKKITFYHSDMNTVKNIWIPYFDLERDYSEIKRSLIQNDKKLKKAINEKHGVRILNQEFHETLISFIISQNKQIPHIKQLVQHISETYGEFLGEVNGEQYYSFPNVEVLGKITEEEFRKMKTGFRAPYLAEAARQLSQKQLDSDMFAEWDAETARQKLMEIKGVGEKVANCVMLFSLGYRSAFPIDIWIKRIMEQLYFDGKDTSKERIAELAEKKYGAYGGYAQKYLFCYGREHNIGK